MRGNGGREEEGAARGAAPPGSLVPQSLVLEADLTLAGERVPVRLGGQSWGQLSAARDNAVLVCHYYTGTMRAAGRGPDGSPGWWDALIGPGRAVDTERYFVVCLNSLSNVQAGDPGIVTTGSATRHPDGAVWGERFPAWTLADLHAAQVALMRQLGLPRWHAVIGPSFGGMQALQWAARTPELAPRVAAVATSPRAGPVLGEVFAPLLRDVAPAGGLEGALRLITLFGLGADGIEAQFRGADFAAYLRGRMSTASLPHILDIGRAVLSHDLGAIQPRGALFRAWQQAGTRLLTVNFRGDQFFPAAEMRDFARQSAAAGVQHAHLELDSPHGHLGCIMDTHAFAEPLRTLLTSSASARGRGSPAGGVTLGEANVRAGDT